VRVIAKNTANSICFNYHSIITSWNAICHILSDTSYSTFWIWVHATKCN